MTDHHLAPYVRDILRDAEAAIRGFDPELAKHLAELAEAYRGPYTEESE